MDGEGFRGVESTSRFWDREWNLIDGQGWGRSDSGVRAGHGGAGRDGVTVVGSVS